VTDFAVQEPPAGPAPADKRVIRPKPAPVPLPAPAAVAVAMLTGLAVLGIWFVLYAVFFSGIQESHSQRVLYSQLRYELAQATVPLGGVIAARTPIAYMQIAAIGLSQVIVEGTSAEDLASGPGHLPDTPLPGQAGNSEIFGRSVTFGGPFANVQKLRPGAIIAITTGQGVFGYRVIDVRGPGDPVPTAKQLGSASITLVTSAGTGWRKGWAPDHVIYADATLVIGKIQPTPSGQPAGVPAIDGYLAGDPGALLPVFLWLAALLLVTTGLAWAYTRWTGWQLWLVGVPAVLALLWLTTSYAILLLPNLA
jgi:sortase A